MSGFSKDDYSDWEEDEEVESLKSLFSADCFPTVAELDMNDKNKYGFSLLAAISSIGGGDVETIMLINFIRCCVAEAASINPEFISNLNSRIGAKEFLAEEEKYSKPFMPGDALLFSALSLGEGESDDEEGAALQPSSEQVITNLQAVVSKYKNIVTAMTGDDNRSDTSSTAPCDDAYYFNSYSDISIHETMLRDHSRTNTYAAALLDNQSAINNKMVLDVGCGTAILSMIAAKAGAKHVIGLDRSGIVPQSRKIVDRNGLSDKVTLVQGLLEESAIDKDLARISESSSKKVVDVIVSEWMGYGLYFENMLASVLRARDEYLAPGGIMLPSHANLYIEGMTTPSPEPVSSCGPLVANDDSDRVGWWNNVYGFDMSDMAPLLLKDAQVQTVVAADCMTTRCLCHSLDILEASDSDLDFTVPFSLSVQRACVFKSLIISFDTPFQHPSLSAPCVLSTTPDQEYTHWKQVVLWFDPSYCRPVTEGDCVTGTLKYQRPSSNPRDYEITVVWQYGVDSSYCAQFTQKFLLCA